MRHFRSSIWSLLWVLLLAPAAAALAADCPDIVRTALQATDQLCETTGRNQACYGHVLLEAQPQPGIGAFAFAEAGDVVDVTAVQSLRVWPMEPESGIWGVALMRLQANLPSTQTGDVTLLTFGDVEIQNIVPVPTRLDVTVTVDEYINVRRGASTQAGPVGVLAPGQTVAAVERLADNTWLRVELPDGQAGWVFADLVTSGGNVDTLNVAGAWTPHYRPMQAFTFRSGADAPTCTEAPTSGLLIQTPEGVGEVNLLINEVNIQIGSTVFFQAGAEMTITTLEGHADVTAQGVTRTAIAGTQVQVPLNPDMTPAGIPSNPEPYQDGNAINALPVTVLDREITIAPSLTQDEIEEYFQPVVIEDTGSAADNSSGNNTEGDGCPGESCDAPGHGGECPGNSCDPGNASQNSNANGNSNGNSNGNANGNSNGNSNGNGNGKGNGNSSSTGSSTGGGGIQITLCLPLINLFCD